MRKYDRAIGIAVLAIACLVSPLVQADGTSTPMIGWHRSGRDYPYSAFWDGSSWTNTVSGRNFSNETVWMVLRNCPTRDEYAMGSLDWNSDVNIQFFSNGSWSGLTEVTSNAGGWGTRSFDLAYEQTSGDLLAAYWSDGWPGTLCYRASSGGGLSSERTLSLPESFRAEWVKLVARPNSDQILLLVMNITTDLYAAWWNGGAFGSVVTLHDDFGLGLTERFDAAFESQSGDLLVVYASSGSQQPRYRTWNGSSWSSEGSLPSVGSNQRWMRLAADPASDQILFACSDDARDLNTNVWNGNSWGSNQRLCTEVSWAQLRAFDIAYENGGGRALIVHSKDWDDRFRYRVWNGSSWSSEQTGANLGDIVIIPQLTTGLNPGEIFVGIQDNGNDLNALLWTGSGFTANQRVESTQPAWGQECFMIALPRSAAQLFTDVSSAAGFAVRTTDSDEWGSGLLWGDLDNDGDLDAIVTGNSSSRLLANVGAGASFAASTFGGGSVYRQGALLDVDNDGDLDFWGMTHYQTEKLFINNGAAAFTDGGDGGFSAPSNDEGMAAADVNGDGRCDALAFSENGNWIGHNQGGTPVTLAGVNAASYGLNDAGDFGNGDFCSSGDVNNDGFLDFFYHYNTGKLFLSNGDGTYQHDNAGISVATGSSDKMGSAWADYDNDGDLDLFVCRRQNGYTGYLWKNRLVENGSVSFVNVTAAAGLLDTSGQRGCCWGDYDNDGDLDLYVVTRSGLPNVLYQNQGPPNWNFAAVNVGAAAPGDGHDAVFVDYDNDGDLDLAVTQQGAGNTLLRNNTNSSNYLEVRVVGGGACGTNAAAVGVRVELWNALGTVFLARREIGVARGYGGIEPMWAHFGGLTNNVPYLVKVRFVGGWSSTTVVPASTSTTIGSTIIRQMLTVSEPQSQAVYSDVSSETHFNVQSARDWGSGLHWGDLDGDGDPDAIITGDFCARLMINNAGAGFTASTFGGGYVYRQGALFDVDNDGDLDFWGIPSYQNERLYLNNGSAVFSDAGASGFSDPYNNEGLAAADTDADGLCDVVMFSENGNWIGSNAGTTPPAFAGSKASSNGLNDSGDAGNGDYCSSGDVNNDGYPDFFYHYSGGKLFLSKGDGTYVHSNYGISIMTGVSDSFGSAWGDYDNDGDLDLFVPRYDAGQPGYLWRNDVNWAATPPTGTFTNVTAAAGITDTSGQRSCCWGDYDNDGDLDLYIVTHSGASNVLYRNQGNGTFVAACANTEAPGNGHDAVFVDYDNDGDLDLAITQEDAENTLLRNNTDSNAYLKVRVIGRGAGATNQAGIGLRVELWNAAGTALLARRDLGTARGYGGSEPIWAHFGGVAHAGAYTVKVYFPSRGMDDPHATTVTPGAASTTIGGAVIPQMLTIEEPLQTRIIFWREVPNRAP